MAKILKKPFTFGKLYLGFAKTKRVAKCHQHCTENEVFH